jgi:hypothetical protein
MWLVGTQPANPNKRVFVLFELVKEKFLEVVVLSMLQSIRVQENIITYCQVKSFVFLFNYLNTFFSFFLEHIFHYD